MKRPIASTLAVLAALTTSACGEQAPPAAETAQESGWVMPPEIAEVASSGRELIVRGQASPLGRVVVSGAGDLAYAVGADAEGRFELRVPRPPQDTLFLVEARVGQEGFPAPYRLLIGADPSAPVALLAIGAPTLRLDAGSGLDAVDTDGRASFVSGRAVAGAEVVIEGSVQRTVTADERGRWRLAGSGDGSTPITIDGTAYAPAPGGAATPDTLQRSGAGWSIAWSSPGGGRQSTWFPDRPATIR
ncbi:hypothetical protein [Brevundimonas sp.]|uniref:hypothetical protein n=1 Tax=Brevundimonas sp. TaxID=1871086 RepID=UPI00286B13C6|nr:hypothetical protein [Brevundimonas sp.]